MLLKNSISIINEFFSLVIHQIRKIYLNSNIYNKKISINENNKHISIEPYDNLKINIEIQHDCELINSQSYSFELLDETFENYLMKSQKKFFLKT